MLTVLLGGARSGKSLLAEQMALASTGPVAFVATSPQIDGDDDLAARVARHRAERPTRWTTIEEDLDLAGAIERSGDAFVVVDCLTTWVGNLQHHGRTESDVLAACDAALAAIASRVNATVVVTNEVGLGIVPANELVRTYRDVLGRVNQRWVAAADHALFLVAGRAMPLHSPHDLLR